jgi:hypothetical protein
MLNCSYPNSKYLRFTEGQPIRQDWVAWLDQLSAKFRNLEQKALTYTQRTPPNPSPQA